MDHAQIYVESTITYSTIPCFIEQPVECRSSIQNHPDWMAEKAAAFEDKDSSNNWSQRGLSSLSLCLSHKTESDCLPGSCLSHSLEWLVQKQLLTSSSQPRTGFPLLCNSCPFEVNRDWLQRFQWDHSWAVTEHFTNHTHFGWLTWPDLTFCAHNQTQDNLRKPRWALSILTVVCSSLEDVAVSPLVQEQGRGQGCWCG